MTTHTRNTVADMEHWAQLADGINRFWSEEQLAIERDNALRPQFAHAALAEHMTTLSEIVADLARQQASTYRALKAAHDAIGG